MTGRGRGSTRNLTSSADGAQSSLEILPVPQQYRLSSLLPVLRGNFDCRHHALVLVREDVAVEDESADDQRTRKGDDHLHLASNRHVDDVAVVVGWLRNAVDLDELIR